MAIGHSMAVNSLAKGRLSDHTIHPAVTEDGKPLLRYLGSWSDEPKKKAFESNLLQEFDFVNPDLDVQHEPLEKISEFKRAAIIAEMILTSNYCWDVVWVTPKIRSEVKKLIQCGDWIEEYCVTFEKDTPLYQAHLPALIEKTKRPLHGPRIDGRFYVSWYNHALAAELGLSVDGVILTFDEILRQAKRVYEYNQTSDNPIITILDFSSASSSRKLFKSLLLSRLADQEGRVPDVMEQEAKDRILLECLQAFEELGKYEVLNSNHALLRRRAEGYKMLNKRALFMFDSTEIYPRLMKSTDTNLLKNFTLLDSPSFGPVNYATGFYRTPWIIFKHAPNRKEAIRLMEYWSRPEVSRAWVRQTHCPTGLRGDLFDPVFGDDPLGSYQERIARLHRTHIYFPSSIVKQIWGKRLAKSDFHLDLQAVLDGRMSAQALFDKLNQNP